MIIHKMTLNNFRQFRGKHEIEFVSLDDPTKNTAVVYGENGRGKTGLFRAMMFALYGERRLSQDANVPDNEIQLVNTSALQESEGKPVRTSVEVTFSHKGKVYNLYRAIEGMRHGDEVIEEIADVRLNITHVDGNTEIIDRRSIDSKIADVLDPRVKEYFLFDGEKIEQLTRAGKEQRRAISEGMRNLLRVDALDVAVKASERAAKSFLDDLTQETGTAGVELARLIKSLGDNEAESNRIRTRLEELADERDRAYRELEDIDKRLMEFKEIEHLLSERRQAESDVRRLEHDADQVMNQMQTYVCKAAALMVRDTVEEVFASLDEQKEKGEIPSEIRRDLIERIISEHKCICGNEVCEGTSEYESICRWLEKTSDAAREDVALDLWRFLAETRSHFEDDAHIIKQRIIEHSNIIHRIDRLRDKVLSISKQIGESEREDSWKLEKIRKKHLEAITSIKAEIQNLESQAKELDSIHSRLTQQLDEEKRRKNRNSVLEERSLLAREIQEALAEAYNTYTSEVRDVIGKSATDVFGRLLDEEGKATLKTIVVKENYSLEVLDQYGQPFLANVSAGQRQIMSISFITALAMAACDGGRIEMPLFMDSPFGRLSGQHRKNIIREIPLLTSQWIILATDTEFRRDEAQALRMTGHWGKFFMLCASGDGNTTIKEYSVDDAYSILPREEEQV